MSSCKRKKLRPKMFLPVGRGVSEEQSVPMGVCNDDVAYMFTLDGVVRRKGLKRVEQELFVVLCSPTFLSQNLYTYVCFSGLLCEIWKCVGERRMVNLNQCLDIVLRYNHWTDNSFTVENWQVR